MKLTHCLPLVVIAAATLLLAGCDDFERATYRTLKVTQVEYALLQEYAARAFLDGRLTQAEWDRFAVAGNRFIAAHTMAADLMETWQAARQAGESRDRITALQQQVTAAVTQLPALLADLRALLMSFDSTAPAPSAKEN